ncbi:MAG: cytochrome c oxidase accessory protein CcoG [Chitinophagaceae bacterium]
MIKANEKENVIDQAFRDSIATIDQKGKRKYIFPKKPKGALYNKRTLASILYLLIFLILPWIKIDGEPFIMLNVLKRKFILFGQIFGPQDFFIFALGMITFVVFIIVFTVIFGRVFCGWACPQTIFMEMVFRKIEYWIEGDFTKQQQLKTMPWNAFKIKKRASKIIAFYLISFIIANYFMAYLISMDEVLRYVHEGIASHAGKFMSLIVFTSVFFFVYYWFREQVCIVVCPYGRLQGVLLDKNSIVVAYDYVRGEPRGKKTEENNAGDCIDCKACVRVCPTGIDIRNGTQLECINCTACIDACDEIMEHLDRPKNLIRFASENNISKKEKLKFTTRIKAYSFVLLFIVSSLVTMLATREEVDITILRTQGMVYQQLPNGYIGNLYSARMFNKTHKDVNVELTIPAAEGSIEIIGKKPLIAKESYAIITFLVKKKADEIQKRRSDIHLVMQANGKILSNKTTTFIGPLSN